MEALRQTDPQQIAITVDNTNSKRSKYKFYVRQARMTNKRFLTAEILCSSEDEIRELFYRGIHHASMQDMGRIHVRWEVDEEAFLFQSGTPRLGT